MKNIKDFEDFVTYGIDTPEIVAEQIAKEIIKSNESGVPEDGGIYW